MTGAGGSSSPSTGRTSSSSLVAIAASSSLAVYAAWRVVIWRARTRARETVDRVRGYLKDDGPLVRIIFCFKWSSSSPSIS